MLSVSTPYHDKNRCTFKLETSAIKSDRFVKDKGKQKEVIVEDLDLFVSKPVASTSVVDARKGSANFLIVAASRIQDEDLSDEMPELDILIGFNTGSCEASSSGAGLKTYQMKKINSSWSIKGKPGKGLPLKDKVSQNAKEVLFQAKVFKTSVKGELDIEFGADYQDIEEAKGVVIPKATSFQA
ncbi:unnamed protein product [Arabidopsis arenosa]|uniref:Uncharacterized protein n=1 Tax=Arabidopsis arenosa TaxID=38785 RepID=A0A8S1ZLT8_ARAAE|nr:unnamed protein product [Arabidopsis arenosa]